MELLNETALIIVYNFLISQTRELSLDTLYLRLRKKSIEDIENACEMLIKYDIIKRLDKQTYKLQTNLYYEPYIKASLYMYFSLTIHERLKFIKASPELDMCDLVIFRQESFLGEHSNKEKFLIVLKDDVNAHSFLTLWEKRMIFESKAKIMTLEDFLMLFFCPDGYEDFFDNGIVIVNNLPVSKEMLGFKDEEIGNFREELETLNFPQTNKN